MKKIIEMEIFLSHWSKHCVVMCRSRGVSEPAERALLAAELSSNTTLLTLIYSINNLLYNQNIWFIKYQHRLVISISIRYTFQLTILFTICTRSKRYLENIFHKTFLIKFFLKTWILARYQVCGYINLLLIYIHYLFDRKHWTII